MNAYYSGSFPILNNDSKNIALSRRPDLHDSTTFPIFGPRLSCCGHSFTMFLESLLGKPDYRQRHHSTSLLYLEF